MAGSGTLDQTVNQATTKATLTAKPSSSAIGQSVTFTVTVRSVAPGSGTPTGTVTFMDGTRTLGPATLDGSGKATFSTGSLAVGSHTITVTYAGDNNFNTSTGSAVTETVAKANTSTTLLASPNPLALGHQVTFTATVAVKAPGSGAPPER